MINSLHLLILKLIGGKQARKLQDAQAEKLSSLQANGDMVTIKTTSCQQFPNVTTSS